MKRTSAIELVLLALIFLLIAFKCAYPDRRIGCSGWVREVPVRNK